MQRDLWTVTQLQDELAQKPTAPLRKYRLIFAEGRGVAWPEKKTFNWQRAVLVKNTEQWLELAAKAFR